VPTGRARPRRLARVARRRPFWYGAAAVIALVVVGVLLVPHGHSAAATQRPGKVTPSAPAGLTADEAAGKISAVPVSLPITAGPLLGPDGRLWTESVAQTTSQGTLVATNTTTYATTTYPLPDTLSGATVLYTGAAAFDGAGHLWLTADLRTGSASAPQTTAVLLRYTPGSGTVQQFSEDSGCATNNPGSASELYTASDGSVWVVCAANILGGGAYYYRVSADGTITNVQLADNAQPGTLLSLGYEELPGEGHDGPLAEGPGGTMWSLDQGDFIELTPGGQEILTIGLNNIDPVQLVDNGTAQLESIGVCDTNDAQGEQSHQCASKVNSDGSETTLAELPDYDGYNNYLVHWAVMDQSGNVWLILDGKANGQAPSGQYYVEVSPGGAVKVIPFTVPGDAGVVVPVSQARPVLTSNGGLWVPDVQQDARWRLIQVVPKQ
jgi:hypothetical protein